VERVFVNQAAEAGGAAEAVQPRVQGRLEPAVGQHVGQGAVEIGRFPGNRTSLGDHFPLVVLFIVEIDRADVVVAAINQQVVGGDREKAGQDRVVDFDLLVERGVDARF